MDQVRIRYLQCVDPSNAARDRYILRTVVFPGDRLADDSGRRLELPQNFSGTGVDRDELASQRTGENEPPRGRQGPRPIRALESDLPFALPGERINRLEEAAMVRIVEDVLAFTP